MPEVYDIFVAGGGPAGLTAALYAARAGKRAAVAEKAAVGGQIVNSPLVENYPGLPGLSGADFADTLREQAERLGVEILYTEVEGLTPEDGGFALTTDSGIFRARSVILATGVEHRSLGLPGEEELTGRGVSYCAVCDGAFYTGADVAVVGGGDTALQDALFLSELCRSVTLLVRRDRFRGEKTRAEKLLARPNIRVLFRHTVAALLPGEDSLAGLEMQNAQTGERLVLPVSGVFFAVGQKPATGCFADRVALTPEGYLLAGEDTLTDLPGVFAAGDARQKTVRQLTTAVGDGATAALAACAWLDENV